MHISFLELSSTFGNTFCSILTAFLSITDWLLTWRPRAWCWRVCQRSGTFIFLCFSYWHFGVLCRECPRSFSFDRLSVRLYKILWFNSCNVLLMPKRWKGSKVWEHMPRAWSMKFPVKHFSTSLTTNYLKPLSEKQLKQFVL